MKIKSILSALLLMVCTMASAQKYLNVKLEDGTYFSFEATPNMEISFDKTAKQGTGNTIVVNGYQVKIQTEEDVTPNDVQTEVYANGDAVKIDAISKTGKSLVCTINGKTEAAWNKTGDVYTFFVSGISENITATIGYIKKGTEKRNGGIDVNWVKLWADGPKFAEYNVGATSASEYGGHYNWGMSEEHTSDNCNNYKSGTSALTGTDDTATKLWGSNWRMPTQAELQALLDNCDVEWKEVNGLPGRKFTGRGKYSSNSVFLPAAGFLYEGKLKLPVYGFYWSCTPYDTDEAYYLIFDSGDGDQVVVRDIRTAGYSVRAVLAED